MAPLDSKYTQVVFNLISVQVCSSFSSDGGSMTDLSQDAPDVLGQRLRGLPLGPLELLDQDEDVVDSDGQDQEGDDLEDDEGGGHAGEAEDPDRGRH